MLLLNSKMSLFLKILEELHSESDTTSVLEYSLQTVVYFKHHGLTNIKVFCFVWLSGPALKRKQQVGESRN